jgi:hypothetical protein
MELGYTEGLLATPKTLIQAMRCSVARLNPAKFLGEGKNIWRKSKLAQPLRKFDASKWRDI